MQRKNRGQKSFAQYALTHCSGPSLTTYRESSQGKMASNHLWNLSWLKRPGKYLRLKCCRAISCRFQFSCFPFFLDTGSLLVCRLELFCSLQSAADLAWLQDLEKSAVSTEVARRAPQCCRCSSMTSGIAMGGQTPMWIRWELEAAIPKHRFEREVYKVLKLFWGQTLSACSGHY